MLSYNFSNANKICNLLTLLKEVLRMFQAETSTVTKKYVKLT